jgi:predicted transport protein
VTCNIGHFGTGDLEIIITDVTTLDKAKPLMERSYDGA